MILSEPKTGTTALERASGTAPIAVNAPPIGFPHIGTLRRCAVDRRKQVWRERFAWLSPSCGIAGLAWQLVSLPEPRPTQRSGNTAREILHRRPSKSPMTPQLVRTIAFELTARIAARGWLVEQRFAQRGRPRTDDGQGG